MNSASSVSSLRDQRGFGVLGVAGVIFALTVIAAFAVPIIQRAQIEARARVVAADLRAAAAAFQAYAHERGNWPPADAAPGQAPTGMAEHLRGTNWAQRTPIGGHYVWKLNPLHQGQRYAALIEMSSVAENPIRLDREQLRELDRLLDDGDFSAGNFRLGFRHQPIFVLEH